MRLNCLSCGHKVELDDAYDDFEGLVKCLCGAMLMIRTEEGMIKGIKMAEPLPRSAPKPKRIGRCGQRPEESRQASESLMSTIISNLKNRRRSSRFRAEGEKQIWPRNQKPHQASIYMP